MRAPQGDDGQGQGARTGVYLGAYAWLEDLRPAPPRGIPVELPPDLEQAFGQGAPIVRDPRNGGYIHAPSLPQARTAAVLRSGYLANATPIPGGIGVLDAGLVGALALYGLPVAHATAAVLVYHAIAFWLPTLGGMLAYARLRPRLGRSAVAARAVTDPGPAAGPSTRSPHGAAVTRRAARRWAHI